MEKGSGIRSGFTLIEIMIVVAIIGILTTLAIPDFLRFAAKAKQSEAKVQLGAIYVSQSVFFGDHGYYAGKTTAAGDAFKQIGWQPEGVRSMRYCYLLDEAMKCGAIHPPSLPAAIPSTKLSFTAIAAGNLDNDLDIDVWTIDNNRTMRNISSDP